MRDLVILIPCRNDGKSLEKIILKLKKYNLLIIDDFSSDNTSSLRLKYEIDYIRNKKNLGYERSIIKGFNHILKKMKKINFIITLDADGQHNLKDISKFYQCIKSKKIDLVIGNRKKKNIIIENKLSELSKKKYNVYDPVSGFKAYKRNIIKKILKKIKSDLFLSDVIPLSIQNDFKIINLNININNRRYSNPKVGTLKKVNKKIQKIIKHFKIL